MAAGNGNARVCGKNTRTLLFTAVYVVAKSCVKIAETADGSYCGNAA